MTTNYKLIQSLSRAFTIINCFNEDEKTLTLNEISEKTDLNINTTRGLVQTLLHYQYLSFDEHVRRYRLGSIFLEKAEIAQFDYTEKIIHMISGDLQRIADKYSVSTRFHSVENLSITTILERKPSRSRYILAVHNQANFPLYASASGKLILAHLSEERLNQVLKKIQWERYGENTIMNRTALEKQLHEIAKKGISIEEDELGDGYSSIAIPIFKDNLLIYTLSVVSTTQIVMDSYAALIKELKGIREEIKQLPEFQ